MKKKVILSLIILVLSINVLIAQTYNEYEISFDKAVHHEAEISATFNALEESVLELRMSRTSPGRYALHEFAKNVYALKAVDGKGNKLPVTRPNPYQWHVAGHDGTVKVTYTLFANRGGGTYSQVDETHAHLNIPATFMYAPTLDERPIKVKFNLRKDLNWKVATQLKPLGEDLYYAPDLHYFMDSPTELSDYSLREFKEESGGKIYNIRFVLHHNGTDAEVDEYFEKVKKIVKQEKAVFGELPDFDFGEYTFLACYIPNASGDGMEHRNSTILTSTRGLAQGGMEGNIGTVSHEFFHAWNVERIRPNSLEPFDYEEANMSGELWFAEGFTSYYTNLILCRSGIITPQQYVEGLAGGLNYVWNSNGRNYFNPVEMSYQAPFVDAARSVDPVNRENTFISYYTYGSVLGLALDLSLRNLSGNLTLDGFMQAMWRKYGRKEIPYTIRDFEVTLKEYAGNEFGSKFFGQYIMNSKMPDYETLLNSVGVKFEQANPKQAYFGASLRMNKGKAEIVSNPIEGHSAYNAGLASEDLIVSIDGKMLTEIEDVNALIGEYQTGKTATVDYERFGKKRSTEMTFTEDPSYKTSMIDKVDKKVMKLRDEWLGIK